MGSTSCLTRKLQYLLNRHFRMGSTGGTCDVLEARFARRNYERYPYPYRGGGRGGQNQPVEFHFFLLGNPGIVIQPLEWNCKVTFLNKPWALVRKYLRLAPEELSASMITAAQFFGGMPSLHMCCFSLTCA